MHTSTHFCAYNLVCMMSFTYKNEYVTWHIPIILIAIENGISSSGRFHPLLHYRRPKRTCCRVIYPIGLLLRVYLNIVI